MPSPMQPKRQNNCICLESFIRLEICLRWCKIRTAKPSRSSDGSLTDLIHKTMTNPTQNIFPSFWNTGNYKHHTSSMRAGLSIQQPLPLQQPSELAYKPHPLKNLYLSSTRTENRSSTSRPPRAHHLTQEAWLSIQMITSQTQRPNHLSTQVKQKDCS